MAKALRPETEADFATLTILIAMKETEDSILFAADSESTGDYGLKQRKEKLHKVPNRSVVWGGAGNPAIGDDFQLWADAYAWAEKTWRQASKDAIDAWANINGEQRRRTVELAKTPIVPGILSDGLLVGWLDRPEIYALSDDGRLQSHWETGFYAVGSGAPHAVASYNTLALAGAPLDEKALRLIMLGTISFAPNCGPPVKCWRITPESITEAFTLDHRFSFTAPASQSGQGSNEP